MHAQTAADTSWQSAIPAAPKPFLVAAGIDLLVGLDLLLFAGWIADLILPGQARVLGMETATLLRLIGVVLIVVAADTAFLAATRGRLRRLLPAVIAAEWAWAAGSLLLVALYASAFSPVGIFAVAGLALVMAACAVAQQRSLRRAGR